MIAAAGITATLSGLLTAVLTIRHAANLNPLNLIDAAILLGLAVGIFRKSRICAILALAYYIINQALRVRLIPGQVPVEGLVVGIAIFVTLYGMGILGTFMWHQHSRAVTNS
jgi:hypothetical protein